MGLMLPLSLQAEELLGQGWGGLGRGRSWDSFLFTEPAHKTDQRGV